MIERLIGTCVHRNGGSLIVDVQGVGYGVEMTERSCQQVAIDGPVTVWVHTHVKEDILKLFGFPTHAERLLFKELIGVNDVGPKVAMAILNTLTMRQLLDAVRTEDTEVLEGVQGIGPKKSKLILLMLKNKLPKLQALGLDAPEPSPSLARSGATQATAGLAPGLLGDLRSALVNFGYKDRELDSLLRRMERAPPAADLPGLIRAALAELSKSQVGGKREEDLF